MSPGCGRNVTHLFFSKPTVDFDALFAEIRDRCADDDDRTRSILTFNETFRLRAADDSIRTRVTLAEHWLASGDGFLLVTLGWLAVQDLLTSGELVAAERWIGELRTVLARNGAPFDVDTARNAWGMALQLFMLTGQFDAARALLFEGRPSDTFFCFLAASSVAALAFHSGDHALMTRATDLADREEPPYKLPSAMNVRYMGALMAGDFDRAYAMTDDLLLTYRSVLRPENRARLVPLMNVAALATGSTQAVRDRESELRSVMDWKPGSLLLASTYLCQVQLHLAEESNDAAADSAHLLLRVAVEHGFALMVVDALEALALVADRRSATDIATRLLSAALAERDRIGYRGLLVASPTTYSDLLTRTIRAEDPMTVPAAVEYAQRSRGERGRPSHGWPSLTPTELLVVDLVAEGRTNADIARTLTMSTATVKSHLTHVFTKLAIANRAELTAKALSRRS